MERDLGALLAHLSAAIVERETPILDRHGISMWEYAVLSCLLEEAPLAQHELSRRTRRDPTRLIRHLDELQARDLLTRSPDTEDRRRHRVALTEEGVRLVRACRAEIRAMEAELVTALPVTRARSLRSDLQRLLDSTTLPAGRGTRTGGDAS